MTQTMERAQNNVAGKENGSRDLAKFDPPRLPYHPEIEARFGVDKASWKALVEAIFPNATSTGSVVLALSYCRARKLDPFKRNVHIVPIWSKDKGCMVDTIWPGIGELRTTAFRTGEYAGRDAAEFGPIIEERVGKVDMKYPEWCRVIVYRFMRGQRVAFAGPQVYWLESYATARRDDDSPNEMWRDRPRGQIEKCAEAAALRAGFPEEVGNDYTNDEAARIATGISSSIPGVSDLANRPALMDRITKRPVSEGQTLEPTEEAVIEATEAEANESLPDASEESPDPDTSADATRPPDDAEILNERLGQPWEDARRVLVDAAVDKSGYSSDQAAKVIDAHVAVVLGQRGKESNVKLAQRVALYHALCGSRVQPGGVILPEKD